MIPAISELLNEARRLASPAKERSLFALGGRGYFENPTSDLLAFFLDPEGEHGFGITFLRSFFEAAQFELEGRNLSGVTVHREVQTRLGNRIDILVRGTDWALVIENKIYHAQANPFDDYESYCASLLPDGEPLFAILSPGGTSSRANWKGISYRSFFDVLRGALASHLFNNAFSKWSVFAREFVLHVENEVYQPMLEMNDEQAAFVENNTATIATVKKLAADYRTHLLTTLRERLTAALPDAEMSTRDDGWAIRCHATHWGKSNLAFASKAFDPNRTDFQASVYLIDLTPEQQKQAHAAFSCAASKLTHWTEGRWLCWRTEPGFAHREDAIRKLEELAKLIAAILPREREPEQKAEREALVNVSQ